MKLWLVMPVKPFTEGKSRLAKVLSVEERAALNRQMFLHVVGVATAAQVLAGILVISRDGLVLATAQTAGLQTLQEEDHDLNRALIQAQQQVLTLGAEALLALPSDLPLLQVVDVQTLYRLGLPTPSIVIGPSRNGGTSALLLHPPQIIRFAFGVDSFQSHYQQALAAAVPCQVYDSPTLAFDVDQPEDLTHLNLHT